MILAKYYGGKARFHQWINSILPVDQRVLYCEPFAGMGSVLLNRPRSRREWLNDYNPRIVNLHRVIRDKPEEFQHYINYTLHSESDYIECKDNLDNMEWSAVKRAWAMYNVCQFGFMHGDGNTRTMSVTYEGTPVEPNIKTMAVSQRLRKVAITNLDYVKVLERLSKVKDSIVYLDPPYYTADTSVYQYNQFDIDQFADLVSKLPGSVCISGYGEEWDRLGWRRYTKETKWIMRDMTAPRTEVLWTNY